MCSLLSKAPGTLVKIKLPVGTAALDAETIETKQTTAGDHPDTKPR
jgi:hypothetical protein